MVKYFNFGDWIDDVIEEFNISSGDIGSTNNEYTVKSGDVIVAYWDRKFKFGFIDSQ